MKNLLIIILLAVFSWSSAQRISFDEDWKFNLGDLAGAEQPAFDDSGWQELDLPHDWSIEGEYSEDNPMGDMCGYLPAGIGWYRKTITVPDYWKGKHVEIAFDGVFMNSTVWANGRELGTRPYGWISFAYDISEEILDAMKITFAVRVDNEKQPAARWYAGSGIYARTWIDVKGKVYIPASGVFVHTEGPDVHVETEITGDPGEGIKFCLLTTIRDVSGRAVANTANKFSVVPGDTSLVRQTITLQDPLLWSVEDPNLYTVENEVMVGRERTDRVETRFGVRDIEWKPETGMWLNGKNVKLRGVCNHQDGGAFGAAVPEKILRFRLQQLKDMGCNAFRTAHNPQTPEFYDMCDEMGMLVMDEIFDGWHKKAEHDYGAYHYDQWWRRDVTDWIRRDRNHPSIVIYSVGNETRGEKAGEALVELCHQVDNTRPVTSGHSASDFMDVYGVNGGSEKMGFFETLEKDRVFIGTEHTHTWQVRGFYRTRTWYRDGYPNERQKPYYYPDLTEDEVFTYDWTDAAGRTHYKQVFNSSYDNAMVRLTARQNIELLRDIPHFAGSFRWTGHDYIGEAGYLHGGWPFKSFMGGAIDMANFEKDLYYLYQSQWTSTPMLHILPHWTHPTLEEGVEIPVWAYSNCDEVELFLNGESLGRKSPGKKWDKMQCQWMVGWNPGELKAAAYKNGKKVVEKVIRSAGPPARIALSVDGKPLADKAKDIVQVRVTTTDENGEFYPYGENRTYFQVMGPGKIRALDNGSPIDTEKHFEATDRIAFFGLTRAYVESTDNAGDISLVAGCILGEKRQITSKKVSIDVQTIVLRGNKPELDIKVFCTIDGTEPTKSSPRYDGSFEVKPGTTLRALVTADNVPVLRMEERFGTDEGFVFDAVASAAVPGGNQAEDARFHIANVSTQGSGYNGKSFLDFGRNSGGYVEWYQENDGSPGEFNLYLRYSANERIRTGYRIMMTINGEEKELLLPATSGFRKQWEVFETSVRLDSGANTIRFTALEDDGLCIDELKVK